MKKVFLLFALIVMGLSVKSQTVNIQKELAKSTSFEADVLREQLIILNSGIHLINLKSKTVKDLNKEYPNFNMFLKDETTLNQKGQDFLKERIRLYELETQYKFLIQKISETNIKLLEIENTQTTEYISFWEKVRNTFLSVGNIVSLEVLNAITAVQNKREVLKEVRGEQLLYKKQLESVRVELDFSTGLVQKYSGEV